MSNTCKGVTEDLVLSLLHVEAGQVINDQPNVSDMLNDFFYINVTSRCSHIGVPCIIVKGILFYWRCTKPTILVILNTYLNSLKDRGRTSTQETVIKALVQH